MVARTDSKDILATLEGRDNPLLYAMCVSKEKQLTRQSVTLLRNLITGYLATPEKESITDPTRPTCLMYLDENFVKYKCIPLACLWNRTTAFGNSATKLPGPTLQLTRPTAVATPFLA